MRSNRISEATVLGAALATLLGTAAFADSIYVGSPAVVEQQVVERQVVTPAQVVVPTDTTTTVVEKRVVAPTVAPTVVEQRSVVSTPAVVDQVIVPAQPDVLMKRSVTFGTTAPAIKTTTSAATLESCAAPVFHTRIQNMKDQVNLGLSKGLLSAENASAFGTRLEDLKSEADSVVAEGTPKNLSDKLEKKLTGINIEISNAMEPGSRIQ